MTTDLVSTTPAPATTATSAPTYRSTVRPVRDLLVSVALIGGGAVGLIAGAVGAVMTGTR